LIGLCEIKTNVEVKLFLAVGFFEVGHDFSVSILDLCSGSDDGNLLIFLLDIVERMIDFLKGRLSANAKLSNTRFSLKRWHVIYNCLYLIRIEVKSFDLKS